MTREQGVPLMFTIAQASSRLAKPLGDAGIETMQERGRQPVGKVADITASDPEKITDTFRARVGENGFSSTGIFL